MIGVWRIADFSARNGRGLVPFRCLPWSSMPELLSKRPALAKIMMDSDPDSFISLNRDSIAALGFSEFVYRTDFGQILSERLGSDRLRAWFAALQ